MAFLLGAIVGVIWLSLWTDFLPVVTLPFVDAADQVIRLLR